MRNKQKIGFCWEKTRKALQCKQQNLCLRWYNEHPLCNKRGVFLSDWEGYLNQHGTGVKVKVLVTQLWPALWDPRTVAHQAPLSMGFSRQEHWGGLQFPSPGDLPNPGIEAGSPILQADSLPSESPGKPLPTLRKEKHYLHWGLNKIISRV